MAKKVQTSFKVYSTQKLVEIHNTRSSCLCTHLGQFFRNKKGSKFISKSRVTICKFWLSQKLIRKWTWCIKNMTCFKPALNTSEEQCYHKQRLNTMKNKWMNATGLLCKVYWICRTEIGTILEVWLHFKASVKAS